MHDTTIAAGAASAQPVPADPAHCGNCHAPLQGRYCHACGQSRSGEAVPVYEVNVEVEAGIADAYRAWLDAHVREILALPGFLGANVMEVVDPAPATGTVALCVRYRLRDAAALEAYLREHAPRLRADGVARLGDRFRAWRRILHSRADY